MEKPIRLEELVEGSSLFQSKGVSTVKVTYDGVERGVEIPIKSSGVTEIIDAFDKKAPTPPSKNMLVKPDDDLGKELKITKKQWIQVLDTADPVYISDLEKHRSELGMKIVLRGIDLVFKNSAGEVVDDEDKQIEILRSQGMTGEQFSQLVKDIANLTRWTEDREETFLG